MCYLSKGIHEEVVGAGNTCSEVIVDGIIPAIHPARPISDGEFTSVSLLTTTSTGVNKDTCPLRHATTTTTTETKSHPTISVTVVILHCS